MSPRSHQELQRAFSKTLKNHQFLKVFGSRGLPREPQEAQEGSQEAPKELQNPPPKNPKLSPKINKFWINFGTIFGTKNPPKPNPKREQKKPNNFFLWFFITLFFHFLVPVRSSFWTLFGPTFWDQIGPRVTKMSPRRPSGTSKSLFKNPKKLFVFSGFWVQRPPKRASRGPRRLPRGTQRAPKHQKIMYQK